MLTHRKGGTPDVTHGRERRASVARGCRSGKRSTGECLGEGVLAHACAVRRSPNGDGRTARMAGTREATVIDRDAALPLPPNPGVQFLASDRPDAPRADGAYGRRQGESPGSSVMRLPSSPTSKGTGRGQLGPCVSPIHGSARRADRLVPHFSGLQRIGNYEDERAFSELLVVGSKPSPQYISAASYASSARGCRGRALPRGLPHRTCGLREQAGLGWPCRPTLLCMSGQRPSVRSCPRAVGHRSAGQGGWQPSRRRQTGSLP